MLISMPSPDSLLVVHVDDQGRRVSDMQDIPDATHGHQRLDRVSCLTGITAVLPLPHPSIHSLGSL